MCFTTHTPILGRVDQGALELPLSQIRRCHFFSDHCVFGCILAVHRGEGRGGGGGGQGGALAPPIQINDIHLFDPNFLCGLHSH